MTHVTRDYFRNIKTLIFVGINLSISSAFFTIITKLNKTFETYN